MQTNREGRGTVTYIFQCISTTLNMGQRQKRSETEQHAFVLCVCVSLPLSFQFSKSNPPISATFEMCHPPEGGQLKSWNKSAIKMSWMMPPLQVVALLYDKHEYAKKRQKSVISSII